MLQLAASALLYIIAARVQRAYDVNLFSLSFMPILWTAARNGTPTVSLALLSTNSLLSVLRGFFRSGYAGDGISVGQGRTFDADYLQKPFSIEQLASKVRAVLDAEPPRETDLPQSS